MKHVTAWAILVGPIIVLVLDFLIFLNHGPESTITGVVRNWGKDSYWPEIVFVLGAVVLYLHFFRDFP